MKKAISLTIDEELLEKVDDAAETLNLSRNAFIVMMLSGACDNGAKKVVKQVFNVLGDAFEARKGSKVENDSKDVVGA